MVNREKELVPAKVAKNLSDLNSTSGWRDGERGGGSVGGAAVPFQTPLRRAVGQRDTLHNADNRSATAVTR